MRIAPIAAVAGLDGSEFLLPGRGEHGAGNVQILLVVDLIPLLPGELLGANLRIVQHGDNPQHLLIILVVTQSLGISLQEGHIVFLGELSAELIEVHRFIILRDVRENELAARYKCLDTVIL